MSTYDSYLGKDGQYYKTHDEWVGANNRWEQQQKQNQLLEQQNSLIKQQIENEERKEFEEIRIRKLKAELQKEKEYVNSLSPIEQQIYYKNKELKELLDERYRLIKKFKQMRKDFVGTDEITINGAICEALEELGITDLELCEKVSNLLKDNRIYNEDDIWHTHSISVFEDLNKYQNKDEIYEAYKNLVFVYYLNEELSKDLDEFGINIELSEEEILKKIYSSNNYYKLLKEIINEEYGTEDIKIIDMIVRWYLVNHSIDGILTKSDKYSEQLLYTAVIKPKFDLFIRRKSFVKSIIKFIDENELMLKIAERKQDLFKDDLNKSNHKDINILINETREEIKNLKKRQEEQEQEEDNEYEDEEQEDDSNETFEDPIKNVLNQTEELQKKLNNFVNNMYSNNEEDEDDYYDDDELYEEINNLKEENKKLKNKVNKIQKDVKNLNKKIDKIINLLDRKE